jgi:hypothetical protein
MPERTTLIVDDHPEDLTVLGKMLHDHELLDSFADFDCFGGIARYHPVPQAAT